MPNRYDPNTKTKAIRLVREHRGDYSTEHAAITAIAGCVG
jgi:transposase